MRVCFLSRRFFPAVSGMSVYAANLLRELGALGHDVTMLSDYRADPAGTAVYGGGPPPAVPGARVIGLESAGEAAATDADGPPGRPADFERDLRERVARVEALHREHPFDLLHAQYGYPNGFAALEAGRRLRLPVVVSIQGGDGHWVGQCCGTHRRAMQAVLAGADALLIGSRSFAEEVHENLDAPLDRFTIVPGAVDVTRFAPRPGWTPGALLDPAEPRLVYHGRVDRRKGALDLLDALARLTAGGRRARLVVSGIGPDSGAVAERSRELGLTDRVTLRGPAAYDDVPRVYHEGDVFASPTYAEGFSNTILEAMASGLPVVSTRSVGVVDCLRGGENGLLVDPGHVAALTAALARVLDDAPLRARLAAAALAEVRATYSWPAIARQIVGEYDRVLREYRGPDPSWAFDDAVEPCRFRAAPHLL